MSNEFLLEVFHIRIKIKNNLKNYHENNQILIETFAIKNKNKINYNYDNTMYKLLITENNITLIRDSKEFTHNFIFDIDNITKSEYYIKELNTTIAVSIKTTKINQTENRIEIEYEIIENNNKYSYILDME